MAAAVKVPEVGESIKQGLLVAWLRHDGEQVSVDDPLFELETDKITMTVAAEQAGKLSIEVQAGATVDIGQVVGHIDPEAQGVKPVPAQVPQTPGPAIAPPAGMAQVQEKLADPQALEQLTPAVRRLIEQHGLDPARVKASDPRGRLTKGDVLRHLEWMEATKAETQPAMAPATPRPRLPSTLPPSSNPDTQPSMPAIKLEAPGAAPQCERQTRTRLSPIRQRIAERLVQAQQTAAILTTFNEADMSAVLALRARFKDRFTERHGVALGFMSFFVKAVVDALKAVPKLNAQIQGDEMVQNHYYDIGVAVSTPRGLIVPVVRGADALGFADVERQIAELAARAREGRITLPELEGGVFTVSNGGIYGSLLSTPILNPPQSGVLGMHAIKQRPVAIDGEVVIRPMMYLALSYDHRLVDGQEAVTFLKHVVECVEQPARYVLEV